MEPSPSLAIAATSSSPEVRFEPAAAILTIRGESYPENSFDFYAPVFAAVESHLKAGKAPLTLDLSLSYLNTSSIKCLIDLLDLLEDAHKQGCAIRVDWRYDKENERALEMAEEFMEDVTFPFNLIAE